MEMSASNHTILPQHLAMLNASGISDDVREARGYYSAVPKAELGRLGFSVPQRLVPAMVLPLYAATGALAGHQIRPDAPRWRDGKDIKYETPAGGRSVIDVHP